ncbi:MAG: phage holin family protein [Christensenellales bacterium]|jgi:toxin secretion/phage lysis holin
MKQLTHWLTGAFMTALAWMTRALGGWDGALGIMFLLMGLDLLSGLVVAFYQRSDKTEQGGFRSRQFFLGVTRKLLMVLLVILGTALDTLLDTSICRLSVIGFYAANEALSVVENAALLGVPFPRGILQSLERYQQTQNQNEGVKNPAKTLQ